jgi:hypothetical protein
VQRSGKTGSPVCGNGKHFPFEARYKEYSYGQGKLIPISFQAQIVPGSFEWALNDIVDNVLDLSIFEGRFRNDETGAPAYDPKIMLKIVLYAYSRGINHSRDMFDRRMQDLLELRQGMERDGRGFREAQGKAGVPGASSFAQAP